MCKARVHTRGDVIIKPTLLNDIHSSHTHGSDPVRIDMLKGYNKVKERSIDSEESTRIIVSYGIEQMGASSVAQLPKLESVKRTIRTKLFINGTNLGLSDFSEFSFEIKVTKFPRTKLPDEFSRDEISRNETSGDKTSGDETSGDETSREETSGIRYSGNAIPFMVSQDQVTRPATAYPQWREMMCYL